jgi:hypothetical protein
VERELAQLKNGGVNIPELSDDDLLERGKNLYRLCQYDKAAAVFKKLLDRKPPPLNRPEALFHAGLASFNLESGRRGGHP